MHIPVKRTPLAVAMLLALNSPLYSPQANADVAAPGDRIGSEFKVNTITTSHQMKSSIAMDADGDFVVVWESSGDQDGSGYGIYAQRYTTNGTVAGTEFLVNSHTTADQRYPSIAMDADGDFVVAWQSRNQDGSNWGIYAQRYSADGTPSVDGEFRVNSHTSNAQTYPQVAMDADGDFVVAWDSDLQDGSEYGVYAQRYNANGIAAGDEFQVNTYTTNYQLYSRIAMDADGDFVVAWTSNGQDGDSYGIYARRYNADGSAASDEFQVNSYTTNAQFGSTIAMDADGDFVVAWDSRDQEGVGSGYGIYAQRYSADGTPSIDGEFKVNTYTTNSQEVPRIAMDADGDFVVAWQSRSQDGLPNYKGVYAQRYNADGTVAGGEFPVNSYTTNQQGAPRIAMDADGDFVVAWQSNDQEGVASGYGIYAQRYAGAGNFAVGTVDLNLVVTDDTDPVSVGNNFVYSLMTTNNGSGIAMDVNLSDALPAGVSYVSDDGASVGWKCSDVAGTVSCNKPFMTAAEFNTISLTVSPGAGGTASNTVTVNAAQIDENTVDNTDTETTVVEGNAVASSDDDNGVLGIGSMQGLFSLLIALPLWLRRRFKA